MIHGVKIEVIEPHGMCAGVDAAVAKARRFANAYCLHAPVHSEIVVDELKGLGCRIVDRIEDVPDGETVVFPAHGVTPGTKEYAAAHGLRVVDATCPSVERTHRAARDFVRRGLPVAVIGDPDHDEVKGILGEIPDGMLVDVGAGGNVAARRRIGVVAQTSMNSDEVARQVELLKGRYDVEGVPEVCRATKDRQDAVRGFCARAAADGGEFAVLVLGSRMSANAKRLVEVAGQCGARAILAGGMDELRAVDFAGVEVLGVTSGASTPGNFFAEAVRFLMDEGGES